ncbi:MAG: hypothetical protein H6719_13385 [Sandaracinaceae bacterium]|nr:hypothetical protein [Sandaracinaceae bacterium]
MDSIHERWHPESGMQLVLDFTAPKPATPPAPRVPPTPRVPPAPAAGRPPVGRARLLGRIRRALEVPADLVVTDNRRTMISTKKRGGRLEVRLHHMFLDAPDEVVEELLSYLTEGDPRASHRIGRFIEENRDRIKRRGRRVLLRTSGEHHDLEELLETVTREHLPDAKDGASITWGRCPPKKGRRRRRRSIRLGTYTHESQLIRIHPALDQAVVPRFFVAFVVFHELLHHVVPAREVGGRFDHHPPEFKRRERAHPDYAAAVRWEAENLDLLLRFRGRS